MGGVLTSEAVAQALGRKVMSLRLSEELAAEVAIVARVEGVSISEAIRAALCRYISTRRTE